MITVTSLSKRYGPLTAVDDVSFTCQPGTITGASNYNVNLDAMRTQYHGTMRVDHIVGENDRVYVRYVNQHNYTPQANVYPEPAASGIGPVTRPPMVSIIETNVWRMCRTWLISLSPHWK